MPPAAPTVPRAAATAPGSSKAWSVLIVSTLAFTVCFMVWMMFGVIGIPIKKALGLSATEFGLLTAMPVLTGSLIRVPLGIWTDRYGGRIVMAVLMAVTVPAIWLMGYATQYWQFLVIGLFVGLAGGSFSVGTPYVARWFPRERQGMAMGVYGAGNSGAAVNKFVAPALVVAFGWTMVPHVYAAIMLGTVIVFWLFSHHDPAHLVPAGTKFGEQLKALRDPVVLKYCQYYSIVFGGYVALSLWMVQYYVGEYGLDIRIAALLAACFSLPGGVLRAIGGVLSDKYGAHQVTWWVMWVSWICLFLLSYPQTEMTIATVNGPTTIHIGLNVYTFTALMAVLGVAWAFGKASTFKYISEEYPRNIGAISGIVGLAGGLGGFILPIMFGALMDLTGIRSSAFMLMYGVVWVSLVWMYWTEVRKTRVMGHEAPPSPLQHGGTQPA
ncbi:MAG: NarK/NasA family nitrate transporter [Proteobacteria bacterium]|nr:NarK/NasA family nitrate transporter [Pseudomonadota bacterium]